MTNDNAFAYAVDADGIATITWDQPGKPVNVLSDGNTSGLLAAVERALADPAARGVIIASGKSTFIAGADLEEFLNQAKDVASIMNFVERFHVMTRRIETGGKPFVAAVNGSALGGGLEVALACHHRIAADNPKAQIGLPEATLGLLPGGGGTQRLSRMIGFAKALPPMMEGKRFKVAEAQALGMVDAVVPAAGLLAACKAWLLANPNAKQPWDEKVFKLPGGEVQSAKGAETFMGATSLLRQATWGNAPAPLKILNCVYEGLQVPIDAGLLIERRYFAELLAMPSAKAQIRTTFFGVQDAGKLKARPKAPPKTEFARVGILGAGMMGAGIAHAASKSGIAVVLLDRTAELAEAGKAYGAKLMDKRIAKGRMTEAERDAVLARVHPTAAVGDLAGCSLIVEAVSEDRAIKNAIMEKVEAVVGADCVWASNTSTLPITGLAEASQRPAQVVGLHFFSPAETMPLVEVIKGKQTGEIALAAALDLVQKLGKTPIVVNDGRGFYTSRVFGVYVLEGLALLGEGVAPALIDNAGRLAGLPVGPLAVTDEVSLALLADIRAQARQDMGAAFVPHPGDAVLEKMVALGRHGRKAGKGFYDYPADRSPKRLWPGLAEVFPRAAVQPEAEEVTARLLGIQGLETVRCLDEGILAAPIDADVGSVLGWGFPPSRGGVIAQIDIMGPAAFVARCEDFSKRFGARFAPTPSLKKMAAEGKRFYGG